MIYGKSTKFSGVETRQDQVETYLSDPSGDAPLMVDRITSALPRISLIDFYIPSLTTSLVTHTHCIDVQCTYLLSLE